MTEWRKILAGTLTAFICLFGLTATVDAAAKKRPVKTERVNSWDRKASDHSKLDRKLNDRADKGGSGTSRVIVTLKPGYDLGNAVAKLGGKRGRKLGIISGEVVELPNHVLRTLADHPAVESIDWDRPIDGKMNRAAVVAGARAVQQFYGYDGAGIGVAVIDSGITAWHDDLTYRGSNPAVKVVGSQRVTKFVDFVNGRLTPYDDNGHGTHVSGIISGNGYDTWGARAGIAPAANIVSLKVLDERGGGYISNVIAALDWAVANKTLYNIRVINLSVGASITESYMTDPLTVAARRAVDANVVVVTAAGNMGKNRLGATQYGGITAPGNAPWVLTVGAYSHEGTISRYDDRMGGYSSRGPTAVDFGAKPDISATGTGIISLAAPGSLMFTTKASYLLNGVRQTSSKPYLSLTGTSMASPVVAGTVALMLQANPNLTPNLVKAIIQYTSQNVSRYDALTQGAGFLNTKGAVDLAKFLKNPQAGQKYPSSKAWSRTILWGNHKLQRGVIKPAGSAWALSTVWGTEVTSEGDNIVWGTAAMDFDNIVWGTAAMDADNIVWGTFSAEGDNIVWGTITGELDNIVWGTMAGETDNIVWGTMCEGANCEGVVWGTSVNEAELDNIVWGTQIEADNIVWGTSGEIDNIVWATASEDLPAAETPVFDDPEVPSEFDGTVETFNSLFDETAPAPVDSASELLSAPPAIITTDPITVPEPILTIVGGGF